MKINIGAGDYPVDGHVNLDRLTGGEAYPLRLPSTIEPGTPGVEVADGSVDEIRASHVLEHFSHREVANVLDHWVKKLKPGGVLKIAVPNLEWIAREYLAGRDLHVQAFLMGGQIDENDYHKCAFDEELLAEMMRAAGLIDIAHWESEIRDCASLPVSLNLMGRKPEVRVTGLPLKVVACMSVPRLGFDDNFICAFRHLPPRGIPLIKFKGAFWEQCIERAIDQAIGQGADAVLTIDYDTLFTGEDVDALVQLMREHPEADAIAPLQSARWRDEPLLTLDALPIGVKSHGRVPPGVFAQPLTKLKSAHFGLTLIRVSALKNLQRPWFWSQPAPDGTWGEERSDADCTFWNRFREAGCSLYSANRVVVGHLELMVFWPGRDFAVVTQPVSDFMENGKSKAIWQ